MKIAETVRTMLRSAKKQAFQSNAYGERHYWAFHEPKKGHERALVHLVRGLVEYADTHEEEFGRKIADDNFFGPEWLKMLSSVRALLNGEIGRFDGGLFDTMLCTIAEKAGFEDDDF